jgi:hypothetical protein
MPKFLSNEHNRFNIESIKNLGLASVNICYCYSLYIIFYFLINLSIVLFLLLITA